MVTQQFTYMCSEFSLFSDTYLVYLCQSIKLEYISCALHASVCFLCLVTSSLFHVCRIAQAPFKGERQGGSSSNIHEENFQTDAQSVLKRSFQ